ncbi:MAG: dTDP-4-dehydrorhamnose reductase [Myxococcales bacterium]
MTTLVTGAHGLVGSRVVARLKGERVIAVGREELDLRQPERIAAFLADVRPDGIIHCGAMTDVDACEKDPETAWAVNAAAVAALAKGRARLTALSTDYVFDGVKGDYSEEDAPNPQSAYARSKLAGELAALSLSRDRAVCRVALVYSGYPAAKRTFASAALEALRKGEPVRAFADQIGSPTLADNAAEMVIAVHRSGEQGVFHCGGATQVSRVDFVRALARKIGADERSIVPVPMADVALLAPRPRRCGLRVEKVGRLAKPLELSAALDRFLEERG